jgi:hypothetical protein
MFTRCTETYTEKSRWLTVLNYPIFQINSSPRIIIQVNRHLIRYLFVFFTVQIFIYFKEYFTSW